MGSGNSAAVRALASHYCGPGSIPSRCHMWIEFVVGSRLAPKVSNSTRIEDLRVRVYG